jgi:glucose/arabinose dehydrogenase
MKSYLLATVLSILSLLFTQQTFSQVYPANFSHVEVASGILNPTAMTFAPDGRIFICQQDGALIVIKNGVKLATPAIQLSVNTSGERGLVGITLHPSFSTNNLVYLYYTLADGSRNRVSRFTMTGDVINPATEQILLNLDGLSPTSPYHNGGAMQFKGDKLYIAVGDNSTGANAQNLDTYKGKLLRLNANGTIPGDNPFIGTGNSAQRNSVWAYGFRNPFTIDIQPGTGRIFVNDVGQVSWEEVNDATEKGKNFGWPSTEGNTANASYTSPTYAYAHGTGDGVGCAITGGVFFNPPVTNYPAMYIGKYFFHDYCNAWINYIDVTSGAVRSSFGTGLPGKMLGIDVGNDGNLYFLSRNGRLYKIIYKTTQQPQITDQPDPVTVAAGQPATFNVSATGALPLTYQWKRNNVNIPGATTSSYSIANVQSSHTGNYTVTVSNSFGSVNSNIATLSINANNTLPTPVINTPVAGAMYRAGETISFSGTATDPEDGTLPASAFSWSVVFHHNDHAHDGPPIASGVQNGSFYVPTTGETSANVFYRLHLTVTDSQGLTNSTFVDIKPHTTYLTLKTNPPGLMLNFDDQPFSTPYTAKRVEGVNMIIGAPSADQLLNGETFHFESWAHGGSASQVFPTPVDNTTYTGNFSKPLSGAWRTTDIGKLNVVGNASLSSGTFALNASGVDIWNTSDHFRFVYQSLNGDGEIIARVTGITNTHAWAKAGVMMRSVLSPNASHASVLMTPTSGRTFQRRVTTGGISTATNGTATLPLWVRLVRSGNTFSGYTSTDGTSWTLMGSQTISMGTTIQMGLAYTSHNANTLGTATFTNVTVSGGVSSTADGNAEIIELNSTANDFSLFPNPVFGDALNLDIDKSIGAGVRVEIVNSIGQVILQKDIDEDTSGETVEIDVRNVPQGFYFLRLVSERNKSGASFVRR